MDRFRVIPALFAAAIVALFVGLPYVTSFTPDSWTMFELAKSVGRDFFHANTAREYTSGSEYSSAFAPLWPVLVAPFIRLTGSIQGSYVAAFAAYVGFALAAEQLGRRVFGQRGVGLLSALLLLRFLGIRGELGGGRSVPFYLLLLAMLGTLLLDVDRSSQRRLALLGIVTGALVMTRFDALPAALVVLLGIPFLGVRGLRWLVVVGGFALAISPWVAYSLMHFHAPFATDNRYVALSLDPNAFVFDFHLRPALTVRDAPGAWILKVIGHVPTIASSIVGAVMESVFLPLLLPFVLWRAHRDGARRPALVPHSALVLLLLVVLAPIAGYVITGYDDHRYYTASIWLLEFLAVGYVMCGDVRVYRRVAIAFAAAGFILSAVVMRFAFAPDSQAIARERFDQVPIDSLVRCLRQAGGQPADAVWFRGAQVVNPFKFGALTEWRVLPNPSNWTRLDAVERSAFLDKYGAVFVVGERGPTDEFAGRPAVSVGCAMPVRRFVAARR